VARHEPVSAGYVDTVHATDPSAPIRAGLAQAGAVGSAALAIGTLAGGVVIDRLRDQDIPVPPGELDDLRAYLDDWASELR
jgi:hypothetical protein